MIVSERKRRTAMKTKWKMGLSDRIDYSMIISSVAVVSNVLVDEVDGTDWDHFIKTHENTIITMSRQFTEIYRGDDLSLTMVAHIFGTLLATKLAELKKFVQVQRPIPPAYKLLIAHTQATIIVWKQQLEQILLIIEAEQKKPRRHRKTKP